LTFSGGLPNFPPISCSSSTTNLSFTVLTPHSRLICTSHTKNTRLLKILGHMIRAGITRNFLSSGSWLAYNSCNLMTWSMRSVLPSMLWPGRLLSINMPRRRSINHGSIAVDEVVKESIFLARWLCHSPPPSFLCLSRARGHGFALAITTPVFAIFTLRL
jgi:hypothetical protein